jgi:hypothetical protein
MARRRRRASATRKTLIFVLLVACLIALILYLKNGGTGASSDSNAQIVINEVMTSNKGAVPDETGDFPDWIEIHNSTDSALDISGYGLSDDLLSAAKWTFPDGAVIEANGYLVVFCSGDTDRGKLHTGFRLSASDDVILTTVSGTVIDSVSLRAVTSGYSLGRSAEDSSAWKEMSPSPGYPNTEEGAAQYLLTLSAGAEESIGVFINEFMPSNASTIVGPDGTYCDWIELYNTTGSEIDLSGYGISDTPTQPLKYTLPEGTTIPAYGVLMIYCTGRSTPDGATEIEAPFGLAAYEESAVLATPAGRILDQYGYSRADTDISFARSPDGTGDFALASQPTPGYTNDNAGLQAFMATFSFGTGDLMISEAMNANYSYLKQPDGEYYDWIEIHNRTSAAISLAGYALSNNANNPAKWTFPDITLEAGEYLTVLASGKNVSDAQKKNSLETNFKLSSYGDVVLLYAPDGTLLDKLQVPAGHADVSYGRTGTDAFYYATPTPNEANGSGVTGYADEPTIQLASGCYDSAQSVTIEVPEGCTVTYTTDGSTPTESSTRYSGAISISQTTPLRARAFKNGYFGSDTATASYFIYTGADTLQNHRTSLTIISLVADPENFWGGETGIYVIGNDYAEVSGQDPTDITMDAGMNDSNWNLANFNAQPISHPDPLGRNWERDVHFDVIDETGAYEYDADGVVRIFGAYSRNKEQKGIALIARGGYGDTRFTNQFFDDLDITDFKSLILRASGQDATYSRIRDIVISSLLGEADLGLSAEQDIYVQAYRQVVVYINGQYWGVYNLREKITKFFVASHYGISDPDSIDMLMGNGNVNCVIAGNGWEDYSDMVEWAGSHDLSNSANYDYICSLMDVENYATYCAAEIIVGNTDTGNIKYWRSTETDNKWRWLFYDFCWAMNRNDDSSDAYTSGYRRDFFTKYFHPDGHGAGKATSTELSRALLQNASFRALFLEKVALMLNEVYTPEKINARVDECQAAIYDEMAYDVDIWDDLTYSSWQQHCDHIRTYANNYQDYCLKYVQNYFSLSDSEMMSIFGRVTALEG